MRVMNRLRHILLRVICITAVCMFAGCGRTDVTEKEITENTEQKQASQISTDREEHCFSMTKRS